jgi:hypothetical protein
LFWRCQSLCPTADGAFIHCHVSIHLLSACQYLWLIRFLPKETRLLLSV